jgi:hypothetical protein
VNAPGNREYGLVVLLVSELHVVARQNLTQVNHTTLAGSTSSVDSGSPTPQEQGTVSRLSSRVGEGWLVVTGESGTRGTQRSTVYVVQGVQEVLESRLGEAGLRRHVTLYETTSRNVYNLVYFKLLVFLVDAQGYTVVGSTEVGPSRGVWSGVYRAVSRLTSGGSIEGTDEDRGWSLHEVYYVCSHLDSLPFEALLELVHVLGQWELNSIHIRMILEWKGQLLAPIGRERYHSVSGEEVFHFPLVLVYKGTTLEGHDLARYCTYETPFLTHE